MSKNDKKNPTNIESDYVARSTEELNKSVAEEMEVEDPTDVDVEEVIDALEPVEDEEEEDADEAEECDAEVECHEESESAETPNVRHRGPRPDGNS